MPASAGAFSTFPNSAAPTSDAPGPPLAAPAAFSVTAYPAFGERARLLFSVHSLPSSHHQGISRHISMFAGLVLSCNTMYPVSILDLLMDE